MLSLKSRSAPKKFTLAVSVAAVSVALAACGSSTSGESSAPSSSAATPDMQTTAASSAPSPSSVPASPGSSGDFVIGAWGGSYNDATKEAYTDPYSEQTGSTFKFDDAAGTQVAKLQAQQRAGDITWDLIDSVAAADAYLMNAAGLLEPLPADLKSRLEAVLGAGKVTDFGFSMGTLSYAITCNMDTMTSCPENMEQFFDVNAYPQSRELPAAAPLELLTMAAVANGASTTDTSSTDLDLDAAFSTLQSVKPTVKVFYESTDQSMQALRSNEVDMGLLYTGAAWRLADEGMNVQINYAGGGYEPGYWSVVKGSKNTAAAFDYLEWVANNAAGQAKFSELTSYSVPNPEAVALMTEEQRQRLADSPEVFSQLAVPNFEWYT
ncbi:MAG: extracellular solute-binding protein, partial [Actinomycetota bacterium]|nr:extracellular solute-binding protein [Actinomycetota bacterium]